MTKPIIQTSFIGGEWSPALNARVDLAKYHSGAALLRNFFVDYRGGATTRPGTRYILQTKALGARLIPFQASFAVTYMLEFGNGYVRFYQNGAAVLENAKTITAQTPGAPVAFTSAAHGYSNGDWLFIQSNYYIITNASANLYSLTDLLGNPINTNPFTLPALTQRVYTISSPYITSELYQIKYAQDVNLLFLCHPNHAPQILTLNSATNWTITPVNFVPSISPPTITTTATTASLGPPNHAVSYIVTAVDINGQESLRSTQVTLSSLNLIGQSWTNQISFTAVASAISYNVYRTVLSANNIIPGGSQYGFIGNITGTTFTDTTIIPNFAITPPIANNPFAGSGVQTVTLTNTGNYSGLAVPGVTFTGGGGSGAAATTNLTVGGSGLNNGGTLYTVGQVWGALPNAGQNDGGFSIKVLSVDQNGTITNYAVVNAGALSSGTAPFQITINGPGGPFFTPAVINTTWVVQSVGVSSPGTGYASAPTVGFTTGAATAFATLGAASSGNPTVPGFFQQRLFLGGPVGSPSQLNLSQPGSPFNFNISDPTQADDAIQETLTNTVLNSIKSVVTVAAGMITFTDKSAWLINGGSFGSPISALNLVANPQSYSGASDLPPIVTTQDILYVQAKGSIVRDLAYNFYLSSYIGADISILSSHLFYGFSITQWCWAEEPFKLVWAVRNDGVLLSLTFIKEQELIAWAHHDTNGLYTSVATIPESTSIGNTDAVYTITQRTVSGQTVQYIERFVELTYPSDYISSWQVDAGIGYNGAAATTFSGANHLSGLACTGVADGAVVNFTMPTGGTFVFGPGGTTGLTTIPNAKVVTVGLAFSPQIQTLALDLGEPTVQGKRKKVAAVTTRCRNALGLNAGKTLSTLVPMSDLVLNNVNEPGNFVVTGLVTGDARTFIDPQWDTFGQYYVTQPNPYPASVLGIIPEIETGDDA